MAKVEKATRTTEVKVAVVGDKHVGKTSLIMRFKYNTFSQHYYSTQGGDLQHFNFRMNDTMINVKLIDAAGHNYVRSLIKSLYRDVHALLVVFDVTREKTLESVRQWLEEIYRVNTSNPVIFLVGNKQDLDSYRTVHKERALQMSDFTNLPYYETSARTGHNVSQTFSDLICATWHRLASGGIQRTEITDSVRLEAEVKSGVKSGGCCRTS